MPQGNIVQNGDSHFAQIGHGGLLEEIVVPAAQHICLTDHGGLHDNDIVHIADGRAHERI